MSINNPKTKISPVGNIPLQEIQEYASSLKEKINKKTDNSVSIQSQKKLPYFFQHKLRARKYDFL
jgi:hypothetical protein